jgi:glutamine synthetase
LPLKTAREHRKTIMNGDDIETLVSWCTEKQITEVECMIPDLAGVARGKILPVRKFLDGLARESHHLPESIFIQTITGEYPDLEDAVVPIIDRDVVLRPDPATIRMVPWYEEPTAQVICDCYYPDGQPVGLYTREVLRRVVALYQAQGWRPVVAPELEFYLVDINRDPNTPLKTPIGRNGRPETARQSYGIDAVNEFDPVFEDVYDFCEAQAIDIDTLNHESGAAQIEINFQHGAPLELADQAFLFKRTVRQTAFRHDIYATFMASPMQHEPGSSMHIHQSILNDRDGKNLFSAADGAPSKYFRHYLGGLQKYLPAAMVMFAPNVNSYRRMLYGEAPINIHWGQDNRSCGLRVPNDTTENRRVENRIGGADVNPYLAIAGTLLCGYLGMVEEIEPAAEQTGNAYVLPRGLPLYLPDALTAFSESTEMREVFGDALVTALSESKWVEFRNYNAVISSWEREHLLLNV